MTLQFLFRPINSPWFNYWNVDCVSPIVLDAIQQLTVPLSASRRPSPRVSVTSLRKGQHRLQYLLPEPPESSPDESLLRVASQQPRLTVVPIHQARLDPVRSLYVL